MIGMIEEKNLFNFVLKEYEIEYLNEIIDATDIYSYITKYKKKSNLTKNILRKEFNFCLSKLNRLLQMLCDDELTLIKKSKIYIFQTEFKK